jgi:hypothetical protein
MCKPLGPEQAPKGPGTPFQHAITGLAALIYAGIGGVPGKIKMFLYAAVARLWNYRRSRFWCGAQRDYLGLPENPLIVFRP